MEIDVKLNSRAKMLPGLLKAAAGWLMAERVPKPNILLNGLARAYVYCVLWTGRAT